MADDEQQALNRVRLPIAEREEEKALPDPALSMGHKSANDFPHNANTAHQARHWHNKPQDHHPTSELKEAPLFLVHPPTFKETPEDSPPPSSAASADEDEFLNIYQFYRAGHKPLELRQQVLRFQSHNTSNDTEIFPKFIECKLSITFNGNSKFSASRTHTSGQWTTFPKFQWFEEQSYSMIQRSCDERQSDFGKRLVDDNPDGDFRVYLRYGLCSVVGTNDETKFNPETSKFDTDSLGEIAIKEVCRFISTFPNQKFKLVIYCDYGSLQTTSKVMSFINLMETQYKAKLDIPTKTVLEQSYISNADLSELTTPDITNRIIDESHELGDDAEKDIIKKRVANAPAQTFLALCVHKRIGINLFKHWLLDHGYNDGNLPSSTPPCQHPQYRALCGNYHEKLMNGKQKFFVHKVEEDRWFHERGKKEVVPISYAYDGYHEKNRLGKGAFSKVWEVCIDITHRAGQSLASDLSRTYALKIFNDDSTAEEKGKIAFRKEIRMLLYLAQYPHHHILTHITSWEQKGVFYILYDKAKSNLRHYTETEPGGILSRGRLLWFFSQLHGLADAVRKVHQLREPSVGEISPLLTPPRQSSQERQNQSSGLDVGIKGQEKVKKKSKRTGIVGYHHDIKPDNILAFERPGQLPILKLSDFGAGKFSKVRQEHESARPTKNANGTLTYFGPEYPAGAKMTRPFDMWALGCVFLELLLWFLDLRKPIGGRSLTTLRQEVDKDSADGYDYFWQRKSAEETKVLGRGRNTASNSERKPASTSSARLNIPNQTDLKVEGYKLNEQVDNVLRDLKDIWCVDMIAFQNLIKQIRALLEIPPSKRLDAVNLANRLDAILSQLEVDLKHNLKDNHMDDDSNLYADWYKYNVRNAEARRNGQPLEPREDRSDRSKKLPAQLARPQNPADDVSTGYSRRRSVQLDVNMEDTSQSYDDSQDDSASRTLGVGGWNLSPGPSRSLAPDVPLFMQGTDDEGSTEDGGGSSLRRRRQRSVSQEYSHRPSKKSRSSQASNSSIHGDHSM